MKICINGVTRNMTPEEEEAFLAFEAETEPAPSDYEAALAEMGVQV